MKKFVCGVCGYVFEGNDAPEKCPQCGAPKEKFTLVPEGPKTYADEHQVGVAKGLDEKVVEGLRLNFTGECSEVGMYLAMSRVADRQGYPEVAEAYKRIAFEEAEHAAKFAELLGEVVRKKLQRWLNSSAMMLSMIQFMKWQKTKLVMAVYSMASSPVISQNKLHRYILKTCCTSAGLFFIPVYPLLSKNESHHLS